RVDVDVKRVAILRTRGAVDVFGHFRQFRRLDGLAEPLPDGLPGSGDVDIAVVGLVDAGRRAGRMIVAGLLGDFALHQIAGGLEVEHEDLRLQERSGDLLALFGFLALQKRDQDAGRRQQPGTEIGDRNADAYRALPRQAGHRHQPAHALRDLIETRPARIGPVLAEAGNAGIDDARI